MEDQKNLENLIEDDGFTVKKKKKKNGYKFN
jgi:hypothetical protein